MWSTSSIATATYSSTPLGAGTLGMTLRRLERLEEVAIGHAVMRVAVGLSRVVIGGHGTQTFVFGSSGG